MDKEHQFDLLRRKIEEADAIVVGGASGMSAAAGFRFYYMNDATFKQIAGQLGEKYHADGFFPLFYHPQIKKGELWAALLREYKYLYECHTGEPYGNIRKMGEVFSTAIELTPNPNDRFGFNFIFFIIVKSLPNLSSMSAGILSVQT